jgi:hypothetical protein
MQIDDDAQVCGKGPMYCIVQKRECLGFFVADGIPQLYFIHWYSYMIESYRSDRIKV